MAETTSRIPSTKAYVGWTFMVRNPKLNVDLTDAPRVLLDKLAAAGHTPSVINAPDTQVKAAPTTADAVPARFRGGPHARDMMRVLDAVGAGRYGEAAAIIGKNPAVFTGDDDVAGVPIEQFAALGMADAVRFLLGHGSPVARPRGMGMTPLHWAAALGRREVVDTLLGGGGADPSAVTWFLLTPGQLADANKHRQVADQLGELDGQPLDGWKMEQVLRRMGAM